MIHQIHPDIDSYESIYGSYPSTQKELINLLHNELNYNKDKLDKERERIQNIETTVLEYTFFLVPKGSPRPRYDSKHFYVKNAANMKKIFKKQLEKENIMIYTRCSYTLKAYQPTPITTMSNIEVILAEEGLIRPIVTPDWDNIAKTYTDALQSVLILNDNLINPGIVEKYYSIKPRIELRIEYQHDFDSNYNKNKVLNSIGFKKGEIQLYG